VGYDIFICVRVVNAVLAVYVGVVRRHRETMFMLLM